MKRLLLILVLPACALQAQAQGTIQFQATLTGSAEVPPNSDPTIATGIFTLDANVLSFHVDVPAVTFIAQSAFIQGPALPGASAPVIFDLGGPTFRPGNDFGVPPGYRFFSPFDGTFGAGPFTLSGSQTSQLESGLWYVNITSAANPDGQLRGQILPVPEPSAFVLLLFGAGLALCFRRRSGEPKAVYEDSNRPCLPRSVYSNNQFKFTSTGVPGYSYFIQASTNLTSWVSIYTNTSPFTFTDASATNYPHRFYKAVH